MSKFKLKNDYMFQLGSLYADTPKAVFAAIAVSFIMLLDGEDVSPEDIKKRILDEWRALHDNQIVPQKPPRDVA